MKSQIGKLLFSLLFLGFLPLSIKAQSITVQNPLEWDVYGMGEASLDTLYTKEINRQAQTAVIENAIATEFSQIHTWEKKYAKYLQEVSGFASSLKAASKLLDDGVTIFLTIGKISKVFKKNPEGAIATLSMNNIYMETITEILSVYTLLNDAIAMGGKQNMLSASERSQLLWTLNEKLDDFSKKLTKLYFSIKMYTLSDVWNRATAGMINRDNGQIAREALSRWKRASKTY